MAWFFQGSGDTRKRRRMGEVAKKSWQEKWQEYFSARKSRRSTPSDPTPSRPKKPAAITAYDEPETSSPRGRSLPRWKRTARAVLWKRSRPLRRFHRRIPAGYLVLIYLGILAAISCALILAVVPPPSVEPQVAAQPSTGSESARMVFQAPNILSPSPGSGTNVTGLSGMTGHAQKQLSLATDNRDLKTQMADIEFRAGRYTEAERLYRALFKESTDKPFLGYRIYVCALLRNHYGQAADLLKRLQRIGPNTPAWHYARATLAYQEGRPQEAGEILREAQTIFGVLCADYDATLRLLQATKSDPPAP